MLEDLKKPADAKLTEEALKFFAWSYSKGQAMAKDLDYIPMPEKVVTDIEGMWAAEVKGCGSRARHICFSGAYRGISHEMQQACERAGFPYRNPG